MPEEKPVLYSCSGCSSAAEVTDRMARQMDREGLVEMSCIAGVGGQVAPLVAKAQKARMVVAVDGCALGCAKACLVLAGVHPQVHVMLNNEGITKRFHQSPSDQEVLSSMAKLRAQIEALKADPSRWHGTPQEQRHA